MRWDRIIGLGLLYVGMAQVVGYGWSIAVTLGTFLISDR